MWLFYTLSLWPLLLNLSYVQGSITQPVVCYDYTSSKYPYRGEWIDCTLREPRNPPKRRHRVSRALYIPSTGFQLNLSCDKGTHLCDKIKQHFQVAFSLISNVITLKQSVSVKAVFSELPADIIGGAVPSRQIPRLDPDQITRLYPQALFKQSGIQNVEYSQSDIYATFNSKMNFSFINDTAVKERQYDFLYIIVHELMHGLGMTTSWNLLPDGKSLAPMEYDTNTGAVLGFRETLFDRYLVTSAGKFSDIYKNMTEFFKSTKLAYKSASDFLGVFNRSEQYRLSVASYELATAPYSTKFQLESNQTIVMETNINGEFLPGSSLTHFDYNMYSNSSDFLMTFFNKPGIKMLQIIQQTGDFNTGPIGPLLTEVLRTLGYQINPSPRNYKSILLNK